jgi:hypothetical protein
VNTRGSSRNIAALPLVFRRNLQCQPVRASDRPRGNWPHACSLQKRAGVGTNGILECKLLPKTRNAPFPWCTSKSMIRTRLTDTYLCGGECATTPCGEIFNRQQSITTTLPITNHPRHGASRALPSYVKPNRLPMIELRTATHSPAIQSPSYQQGVVCVWGGADNVLF